MTLAVGFSVGPSRCTVYSQKRRYSCCYGLVNIRDTPHVAHIIANVLIPKRNPSHLTDSTSGSRSIKAWLTSLTSMVYADKVMFLILWNCSSSDVSTIPSRGSKPPGIYSYANLLPKPGVQRPYKPPARTEGGKTRKSFPFQPFEHGDMNNSLRPLAADSLEAVSLSHRGPR